MGKIRVQNEVEVHTVCQRFLTSWQRPTPWVILYAYTRCVATEYNSTTSKMVYTIRAREPERALDPLLILFCHGTQTLGFVTVCCSMSMVSKTSCSHFFGQGSYYATHTLGQTSRWSHELNLWRLWVSTEANSTTVRDLMIQSVSSLPSSIMVHSRIQQILLQCYPSAR